MDMSHHERDEEEEDGSEFTLHQRLADAITSMLCAALLPNADDTADHHADMLTALDLIAFNILQHNFRPTQIAQAFQAVDRHTRHVKDLMLAAVQASKDLHQ